MRNDRVRWRTLRRVRRLRLIAVPGLAALVLAAVSLATASPADAATPSLVGHTLTMTSNNANDDITLQATGTVYELVHNGGTSTFLRSNVDAIIIDGADQANVDVLLDGTTTALEVPELLEVKNVNADQNSGIFVQGQITITGLSGRNRTLQLGDSLALPPSSQGLPPILLLGPTTFTLAAPATGTSSLAYFNGRLLGNQPLSIQLPGGDDVPRQVTFGAPAGVPTSGDPSRLASLDVSAARAFLPAAVATFGVQDWHTTELDLPDADATLRASRVTGTGPIACQRTDGVSCTGTPALTVDVSEVRAGADPGSSLDGVGSSVFNPSGGEPEQRLRLVKAGLGTLSFPFGGYFNRHSGGTVVEAGTLRIGNANALGTGGTTVDAAGTLELYGGVQVTGEHAPSSFGLAGTITSTGGMNRLHTPVTLLDDAEIRATTGLELPSYTAGGTHDLTVSGPVDFTAILDTTGAVRVAPATTWTLTENLTTTGSLTVDGNLDLDPAGAIPFTTTLAAARIDGSGAIRCGNGANCGTVIAQVTDASGATAFSGGFGGATGSLGNLNVRKAGAGTLVLSGTSRTSGNIAVAAGELRTTSTGAIGGGPSAGTVAVAVDVGARLSGSGSVGGGDSLGGSGLNVPGTIDLDGLAGPETMTTAALHLVGGTLEVGVDSAAAHSQLQVANAVTLTGDTVLRVRAGSAIPDGTTVVIVRKTHVAAVNGTFAGLPEGATVTPTSGPGSFRITYAGGDGNDIALTWIAPPATDRGAGGSAAPASVVRATTPRRVGDALVSTVTVDGPGRITQTATLPRARTRAAARALA
ncbi:MAG: hypothetical protein RL190_713, partial [Actinomycetota bacterium]